MANAPLDNTRGLGYSASIGRDSVLRISGGGQVVASGDLTRAMVLNPLAAAASGLTTLFAMATWASRGNREMELASHRKHSRDHY